VLGSPQDLALFVVAAAVGEPALAAGSAVLGGRPDCAAPAAAGLAEEQWADGRRWAEERWADARRWAEERWADAWRWAEERWADAWHWAKARSADALRWAEERRWAEGCSAAGRSCWVVAHQAG
jgi:hypothetical protein